MKFNPKKHHRRSIRLKEYDYTQPGAYFITIVTFQRECLFGAIVDEEMKLSPYGLVAKQQWEKLSKRFFHIESSSFVVMPNHIHGILVITDRRGTAEGVTDPLEDSSRRAPTQERFQKPVKGSIPTVVRAYKAAVAYRINLMRRTDGAPVWQRNYYEHVVRDEKDWDRIQRYIEANPLNWSKDDENPFNT